MKIQKISSVALITVVLMLFLVGCGSKIRDEVNAAVDVYNAEVKSYNETIAPYNDGEALEIFGLLKMQKRGTHILAVLMEQLLHRVLTMLSGQF